MNNAILAGIALNRINEILAEKLQERINCTCVDEGEDVYVDIDMMGGTDKFMIDVAIELDKYITRSFTILMQGTEANTVSPGETFSLLCGSQPREDLAHDRFLQIEGLPDGFHCGMTGITMKRPRLVKASGNKMRLMLGKDVLAERCVILAAIK